MTPAAFRPPGEGSSSPGAKRQEEVEALTSEGSVSSEAGGKG